MGGHRRHRQGVAGGAIGGLLLLGLAGAGVALAADQAVAIAGFSYAPSSVTVNVGDSVTWTNSDAQAHTASADDGAWDTNVISGGNSATVTFSAAGSFPYHCDIHPTMTGSVTVQAAAAGGGGGTRPPPSDTEPLAAAEPEPWAKGPIGLAVVALAGLAGLAAGLRRTGEQLNGHGQP